MDAAATRNAVTRLAWPAILQSLSMTLVFLVDRAMLGRHSAESLASMQISGPLTWSIFSILGAFSVGAVALVGRATGARDPALAAAAVRGTLLFALGAGGVAALIAVFGLDAIISLFPAAGPGVRDAAHGYLSIMLPAVPLLLVAIVSAAVLQASGNTRTPLLAAVIGNVVNVVINWFLIFGHGGAPELGARGAAIGTVCAIAIEAVILLAVLGRRDGPVTWRGRGGERDALRRVLRVAAPSLGERVAQHVGFLGYVMMIGALGATAMAANQALVSIESICFLSGDGFGIAAAAIVSQRLGAKRPDEAEAGARTAVRMAVILLTACALVFLLVPRLLLSAFSDDPEIVEMGAPVLYVAALAQPPMAVSIVLAESLRGAGATRTVFGVTMLGGLVVRLAATALFVFALDLGLTGIWLGSTADWLVRAALLAFLFRRGHWKHTRV